MVSVATCETAVKTLWSDDATWKRALSMNCQLFLNQLKIGISGLLEGPWQWTNTASKTIPCTWCWQENHSMFLSSFCSKRMQTPFLRLVLTDVVSQYMHFTLLVIFQITTASKTAAVEAFPVPEASFGTPRSYPRIICLFQKSEWEGYQ